MSGGTGEPILRCEAVTKLVGRRCILDGVTLEIRPGEIYGLCGPNGAGKTTLLKIICGLVYPTSGQVFLAGDAGRGGTRPSLGIVTENPSFIPELSGPANLRLLASLGGGVSEERIREVLERVGLDPRDRRRVTHYSLGMRQRLALAQALMESPRLLLLDEPTNGLDPLGIRQVQEIVREEARAGAAVLMTSHLLPVVERVCHRVGFINRGRLVREVAAGERIRVVHLVVSSEQDWQLLSGWTAAVSVERKQSDLPEGIVYTDLEVPDAIRQLVALGVSLEAVYPHSLSLEDTFVQMFGREGQA